MDKKIAVNLLDDGNITLDYEGLSLDTIREILKVSVAFVRQVTGLSYKKYHVKEYDYYATIWMPENLHIDDCETFQNALKETLILYAKLSNDDLEVI